MDIQVTQNNQIHEYFRCATIASNCRTPLQHWQVAARVEVKAYSVHLRGLRIIQEDATNAFTIVEAGTHFPSTFG